ncbi:MAG: hypothetical protein AAGG48_25490 [Planctomycetota bacterium]
MLKLEAAPTTGTRLSNLLFDEFNRHEIIYCHWKSNEKLDDGMRGETDLDLLVSRDSFDQTVSILLDLGFKQAVVRSRVTTPGVLHFYALDPEIDELLHVHLYDRMMTGESLVKSHVLPLENMLLDDCARQGNVMVPSPETDAAVFVLRSYLKSGSVLHSWIHDRGGDPSEFWYPSQGVTAESAFEALTEHETVIEWELFRQCFNTLENGGTWKERWRLGKKVRRRVSHWQRFSLLGRINAYAQTITNKLGRVRRGGISNKVLESGGAVIAFIGGDATGKSTLVGLTHRWLGKRLAVECVHVGKPKPSLVTLPFDVLLPVARKCFPRDRHQSRQAVDEGQDDAQSKRPISSLYAVRAVALAWNRSKLIRKIQRLTSTGEIVICDRYPATSPGSTDGPRLSPGPGQSWLVRMLTRMEHRLYAQNPSPDIAIRLHVSLDTAKERNRLRDKADKHDDQDLEIRHRKVKGWSRAGIRSMHDISTEPPPDQTFHAVQEAIWEAL